MTAPLLFRTTNVSVQTGTVTLTHSLSRTPANLNCFITPKASNTYSGVIYAVTIGTNIVELIGTDPAGTLCDVAVVEFHSLQGGPV